MNTAGGVVNNAIVQPNESIFSFHIDAMKENFNLNFWGSLLPIKVFGELLSKSTHASIVNISSVTSKRAITKVMSYSFAKSAINNLTRWLAIELSNRFGETIRVNTIELSNRFGETIRVNTIIPGFYLSTQNKSLLMNTDGSFTDRGKKIISQTPFKRLGNPDELKGALLYLLSDASIFL